MLNYKIYGEQNTLPPIIMLHGLLGSLDNWKSQATRLSNHYPVVTVDLRNHGHSAHVKGMAYREMASDVTELLAYLDIEHCYLMGHSMGGKVAMTLALNDSQIFDKLLIVDIAPKTYKPRHQNVLQGMTSLPLQQIKTRKEADIWLSDWVSTPIERGFLLKNLKRKQDDFYWQCHLTEIVKNYLKISAFPPSDSKLYNKDTLFIAGGKSDYIQEKDWPLIHKFFPLADIQILQHSGHLPHVDDAEMFYHLVKKFFH